MATIVLPAGNIAVRGVMVYAIAGSFAANLQLMNDTWNLYPALLVPQIHGCGWINTIGHIAIVHYLVMKYRPSQLTLHLLTTLVSLFFLGVCANITELGLLITRWWILVRSLLVVLQLTRCLWIISGNVSHLPAIVIHWSSLLTNIL